ncbi:hypothetical protein AURDEDRAFT_143561 [Auricularia subglabra TFB-10046 SS5]|nr:hypothetical protein AURDEDRAFT_143561 [Auricularia subglabra TFB-10046 SS5]
MALARQTLCDVLEDWNRDFSSACIPPEVLASCFAFLPLEDRVIASHVSRAWRATVLSFLTLWADIRVSVSNTKAAALLSMALERSGDLPVDFECLDTQRTYIIRASEYDITRILEMHMHRIRSLRWFGSSEAPCFSRRAPALEVLQCQATGDIQDSFLGRRAGKLRSLQLPMLSFPQSCPALSTLSNFSATVLLPTSQIEQLSHLFSLCPRLEQLTLRRLSRFAFGGPLPTPPATLTRLYLEAYGDEYLFLDAARPPGPCDLISILKSWDPLRRIGDIHLVMSIAACSNLAHVLHGATDLTIEENSNRSLSLWAGRITLALHPGAETDPASILGPLLAQSIVHPGLLTSLRIPLDVLYAFTHSRSRVGPAALPALRKLDVRFLYEDDSTITKYIASISRLRPSCPNLESLGVDVSLVETSDDRMRRRAAAATRDAFPDLNVRVSGLI